MTTAPKSQAVPQNPSPLSFISQDDRSQVFFVCAILAGLWLRITQLPQQMLFGDEWHAVCTAARGAFGEILTSFGRSDHSIPIALYAKLLMDTVGLSEWGIRIPFLASGALTILVLPLLVRHRVDRFSFILFAWLLALSPTLVFFSRLARPYAIVVLLAFSAVLFFFQWWVEGKMRDALLYIVLTAVAAYLSVVMLPFLLTPFIFFFILSLLESGQNKWRGVRRLIGIGALTAIALLLLLVPPLWADAAAIQVKAGHATIPWSTLVPAFGMLTGVKSPILMTAVGILAAAGMLRMFLTQRTFLCYLISVVLIQLTAILIIRPLASDSAHILARYMVPGLPCILLFTAMGLQTLSQNRWVRNRMVQFGIAVAFCLVLFLSGPYPTVLYRPNNAVALMLYLHSLTGADHHWILKRVPAFYQTLAAHPPGTLTLAEAPHQCYTDPIPLYQEIHRQHVIKGVANGLWCTIQTAGKGDTIPWSDRLRLATMIDLSDPQALVDRGVDFLIFHKRLQDETPIQLPGYRDLDVLAYVGQYQRLFGMPVFEDQDIVVFKIGGKSSISTRSTPYGRGHNPGAMDNGQQPGSPLAQNRVSALKEGA